MAPASSLVNKLSIKYLTLMVILVLIGAILFRGVHAKYKHGLKGHQSNVAIQCCRAEMLMRLCDMFVYIPKPMGLANHNLEFNNARAARKQAIVFVNKALDEEPDDLVVLSKAIIVKEHAGARFQTEIEKLSSLSQSQEKIYPVDSKQLAELILLLYGSNSKSKDEVGASLDQVRTILATAMGHGFYSEQVELKYCKRRDLSRAYDDLIGIIKKETFIYAAKLATVGLFVCLAALTGLIVLLYQLIIGVKETLREKRFLPENAVIEWQPVLLVFALWFLTQIGVIYLSAFLKKNNLIISYASSLSTACSIALIYLLSNGSAILYAYFLALKPRAIKLVDGLTFYRRAKDYGVFSLIAIGILGWFAAMPLVIVAYYVAATFMGSGGSDNPVIAIIVNAAQDNNVLAIVIFYFSLSVLAPVCEESLFRGFLYNHLRGSHGVVFSNLLSSALFSLAHFDMGGVLPLFFLGVVFAYLREKTGSILPCIISHALWNGATFTLILLLFGSG